MAITAAKYGQPMIGETDPSNVYVTTNGITSVVPMDVANRDYRKLQAWVAEGNSITDHDPIPG